MCIFSWADSKIKDLKWYHISLTKFSVLFFTLMLVKFFPQLTSLEWHWYLILGIIAAIPVWMKMMK